MAELCALCGANLALVGTVHRCVPKAGQSSSVANNSAGVANNAVANAGVANKRWAAWRSRHADLYRERQRNLMRQRRAKRQPAGR